MGPSTWRSFRRVTAVAVTSCAVMTAIAGGAAADTPPGTTVVTTQSLTWTCGWSNGCVNAGWWPLGTGDMNGDGHRDMVWQNETTRKVDTWLLDGKGRVTGSKTITGATAPVKAQAVIADMNGDGVTDIVIWGSAQVPPVIWLLDGDGHVTTTQSVPSGCDASGSEPCGLIGGAGADLNADGHTDIVSHNWTTGVL